MKTYTHDSLKWIDLTSPTREEVRSIMDEYELPPIMAEELLSPTLKPKLDLYEKYIYLVLHFPVAKHTHDKHNDAQEVDFIIGRDLVISTRYDTIDPIHKFSKEFEVDTILDKKLDNPSEHDQHAGHLFFRMLAKLYESLENELEYIDAELDEVETNIFAGKEKEMVQEISRISRILLNFKQTIISHKSVLDTLHVAGESFFGETYAYYTGKLSEAQYRVAHRIRRQQETVSELRETNNSLLWTKQNEVMKTLTIMAFVTFPLSLIAGIFGMNTLNTPVVGHTDDFWIIVAGMTVLTLLFFLYFRKRKWLD